MIDPTIRYHTIAKKYPRREVHLICDNYGTHKHSSVHKWFAAHPRFKVHYTPTSTSWLNLVERWFAHITSQAIRRGSFDSVRALERAIMRYLANWNEDAKPFRWTRSARQIKRDIQRVMDIYETPHQGTRIRASPQPSTASGCPWTTQGRWTAWTTPFCPQVVAKR